MDRQWDTGTNHMPQKTWFVRLVPLGNLKVILMTCSYLVLKCTNLCCVTIQQGCKFSSTRCIYLHMLVMVSNCIKIVHIFLTVQVVSELLILQNHRIRMKSAQNSITFHVYTSQCIRYVVFYSSFECLSIEERSLGHRGVDGCLNSNCIKATTINIFC